MTHRKESSSTTEIKIRKKDDKKIVIENKYCLSKYRGRSLLPIERRKFIKKLPEDIEYYIKHQLNSTLNEQNYLNSIDPTSIKWFLLINFGYTHSLTIERIYRVVENLGDGHVNIEFCLELFKILLNGNLEDKSRLAFYIYDLSGKGYIRRQDIFYFVKGSLSWDLNEVRSGGERDLSLIALRILDKDNDGLVSWQDFFKSAKDNPLILNLLAPIFPSDFQIDFLHYNSRTNYKSKNK